MRRVRVIGASGSGKSMAARLLSSRSGLPHVELDSLLHLAGWTPNPCFAEAVRTLRRMSRREVLWNGNRERVQNLIAADHPLWWTWTTTPGRRVVIEQRLADPRWAHLEVVRLWTVQQIGHWQSAL